MSNRLRKWKAKTDPDTVGARLKQTRDLGVEKQETWQPRLHDLNMRVKELLGSLGVPAHQQHYYVSAAQDFWKLRNAGVPGPTSSEVDGLTAKWTGRDLAFGTLSQVAGLLGYSPKPLILEEDCPAGMTEAEKAMSFITKSAEAGLSAETLHNALTGADLHNPKAHAPSHVYAGADALPFLAAMLHWFNPVVGRYYDTASLAGTASTSPLGANIVYARLYPVLRTMTFDRIGLNINTAGAGGAAARLGIYNVNSASYPTSLILDAGVIGCTTTGAKEIVINQQLTLGLYALVYLSNDSTIQPCVEWSSANWFGPGCTLNENITRWAKSQAYGPLPDPYPAGGSSGGGILPLIRLRVASIP